MNQNTFKLLHCRQRHRVVKKAVLIVARDYHSRGLNPTRERHLTGLFAALQF